MKTNLRVQNTVPYWQKYTPKDYFFGDFAHWVNSQRIPAFFCDTL